MLRFLCLLLYGCCICVAEKRLLLTDQDVFHSLQNDLQTLRQKLQQLENSQNHRSTENSALKLELTMVKDQLVTLQQESKPAMSHYVVWGRKTCPQKNGTSLIYSGLIAGKHWNSKGSGVSTLCLPHDPESTPSDFPTYLHSGSYANIWGSEYQYSYRNIAINDDPPCAVCQVQSHSTLMIPAKRSCPPGWYVQYEGVLVGAYSGEYASEYICVDENPEYFEGTRSHNDDGRTLYPVRAICGSLPCPPYVNLQYLSCVVCSQ